MTRSHPASARADVYSRITAEIVDAIEAGAGDWRMPWHHDGAATTRPQNVTSRRRYRGVNVLALWIAAEAAAYSSGLWGTYRQWAALGAQVRKGEHGTTVVFWKQATSRADDDHDEGEAGPGRMFARAFTVFNLAQVEGYEPAPVAVLPESERFAHAEAFVSALKIPVIEGAYDAHYRIDLDQIFMPTFATFRDASAHMGTLLHEVGNIASVLVAGGAGEGAVERYLRHLHCGEQSPGGGRLDARTAAGAATQRCGVIGIAAGASGIRRRLPASRSSAVLAR
jgi:antirestriction protein ArdC